MKGPTAFGNGAAVFRLMLVFLMTFLAATGAMMTLFTAMFFGLGTFTEPPAFAYFGSLSFWSDVTAVISTICCRANVSSTSTHE